MSEIFLNGTRATPVPPEARGQVRLFLADITAGAATMDRASARIPPGTMDGRLWKGVRGAERAIARIRASMPRAPDLDVCGPRWKLIGWRYLAALEAVPGDPAHAAQGCVVVKATIAQSKKSGQAGALFGLAITVHALGRLYQRSPGVDAHTAIFAAHNALLALEGEGPQVYRLPEISIPCGAGVFLARPRHMGADCCPLAVCRTFIATDQTHPDQARDANVWQQLTAVTFAAPGVKAHGPRRQP